VWSIHFGPPASRTLTSRQQNYLIRTESIGGVVTSITACNKTPDKPWTVDQRIKVPYTAEYMMYSCVGDDSLDDDDDSHSKAPFIYASTVVIAMFVVIMMAQFL
jgi:hypothetical protein